MLRDYDQKDQGSIERYAQKLVGKTLRSVLPAPVAESIAVEISGTKSKGKFGTNLETHYFEIKPGNDSAPDFKEAGVELKTTGLVIKKIDNKKELVAKERIKLGSLNLRDILGETWQESSFLKKNALLLLVAYLYEKEKLSIDRVIMLANLWKFPEEDLVVIRADWLNIVEKIRAGRAHELSESDTEYLGACTAGTGKMLGQPFSSEKAKERALSLKQPYVTRIVRELLGRAEAAESISKGPEELGAVARTFEEVVIEKFQPWYGHDAQEIGKELRLKTKYGAKQYWSDVSRAILGVKKKRIEEFEKAGISIKTVRLSVGGKPREAISFPRFVISDLLTEEWDTSTLQTMLSNRILFVILREQAGGRYRLENVFFWGISEKDLEEQARPVWEETRARLLRGEISLPGTNEIGSMMHVRPHAQNKLDIDQLPSGASITKQSFWLNTGYIGEVIRRATA